MASIGFMIDDCDLEGSGCDIIENLMSLNMLGGTAKNHEKS
jgi:hypothetical protein